MLKNQMKPWPEGLLSLDGIGALERFLEIRIKPLYRKHMADYQSDRNTPSSGNQNERLDITSGEVVVIDHYMPACPPFRDALKARGVKAAVAEYGGVVCPLPAGSYNVLRNPFNQQMLVAPLGSSGDDFTIAPGQYPELGKVFVDTRCLLVLDLAQLSSEELLENYRELWIDGTEGQKKARDLIRVKGGAVRYGFSRGSEELSLGTDGERLAIWGTPRERDSEEAAYQAG